MFCQNCGKEIDNGSYFCPSCGAKISDNIEPKSQPTPASDVTEDNATSKKLKFKKKTIIIFSIIAAVVIIGIIVGIVIHNNQQHAIYLEFMDTVDEISSELPEDADSIAKFEKLTKVLGDNYKILDFSVWIKNDDLSTDNQLYYDYTIDSESYITVNVSTKTHSIDAIDYKNSSINSIDAVYDAVAIMNYYQDEGSATLNGDSISDYDLGYSVGSGQFGSSDSSNPDIFTYTWDKTSSRQYSVSFSQLESTDKYLGENTLTSLEFNAE